MTAGELLIAEVESATASTLIVTARCMATVQVGTRLQEVRGLEKPVDLTVVELWRYPGRPVDEIDPPHAARVVLTGTGTELIQPGQLLREQDPAAS